MIFPAMGREVVRLVEPHLRGTALGGFSAFQDIAYGLTGPVAGLLADRAGYSGVFLIGAGAAAAGLVIAIESPPGAESCSRLISQAAFKAAATFSGSRRNSAMSRSPTQRPSSRT